MMRITAVEPTKHDPDRVSVFLDGAFALACALEVWLQSGWHVQDDISPADLARLNEAEAIRALKDRALGLLTGRPRGRVELQRRLAKGTKTQPPPAPEHITSVLDQLAELGLIDDKAFAEFWVEQRDRFRPKGSRALRAELAQQGIAKADADAALQPDHDLERALAAGRRKAAQLAQRPGMDARQFRDHLGPFLQRRGFTYAVVRQVVAQLWQDHTPNASGMDDALADDDDISADN
jgi:regulatory protein